MNSLKTEFLDKCKFKAAYTYCEYLIKGTKIIDGCTKYIKTFVKGVCPEKWFERTYKQCNEQENKKRDYIFHCIPKNIICFDTDSIQGYDKLIKVLTANKLFNKNNIAPSFSNIYSKGEKYYCNHFYFKVADEDITHLNNIILPIKRYVNPNKCGLDIFSNTVNSGVGVVDAANTTLKYDNLQILSRKKILGILKIVVGDHKDINIPVKKNEEEEDNKDTYDNFNTCNDEPCKYSLEQQKELFSKLPDRCFSDYALWFKMSYGVIYSKLDLDLWRDINKTKPGYDKLNNENEYTKIKHQIKYNTNKKPVTIKSLFRELQMDNIKHDIYTTDKPIHELIKLDESLKIIKKHKYDECDIKYLNEYTDFNNLEKYKTLILKSCCGTGKSTTISQYLEHLENKNKDTNTFFLSIVDRISLSIQHLNTFKNNNIVNYISNKKKYLSSDELNKYGKKIICINSILKLVNMPMEEIRETIVYIDEIDSFLKSICGATLKNKKLQITRFLFKLLSNCKQLILSDAELKNNINYILDKREGSIYYLNNKYKTFKNIKANIYNDENKFIEKLIDNIENKLYFFSSFDSRKTMDRVFEAVKDKIKNDNKLLLKKYSSKDPIDFNNASTELKNKFIFHSPTIGTGVDFKIEEAQDVFIHIGGKSIDPCQMFQMLARTRNIKQVYIFGNDKHINKKNITLEDVKKKYAFKDNEMAEDEKQFYNASDFYNLFCYYNYIDNVYATNKFKYFIDILKEQGFNIKDNNNKTIYLSSDVIDKLDEVIHNNNVEKYNNDIKFLENMKFDINNIVDPSVMTKNINFLNLTTRPDYLKIDDVRELIIDNNNNMEQYINLIKFCYTDDKIIQKLNAYGDDNYLFLKPHSIYNKINLIRELEKKYKINIFKEDVINNDTTPTEIDHELFKKISNVFDISNPPPKNKYDIIEIYIKILKKLIPLKDFIHTDRVYKQVNKIKTSYRVYSLYTAFKKLLGVYIDIYVNENITSEYNINNDILTYINYECLEKKLINEINFL